LRENLSKT